MKLNRRQFLALSGTTLPAVWSLAQDAAKETPAGPAKSGPRPMAPRNTTTTPWHQRLRRVGQINFNERDPITLDVEAWADYWAELRVDAVLVSVTGILAFYPTEVPFHRRSRYLGDRDLFGACTTAAKKRGLHVIARMSPDLQWNDAVGSHPEWFMRSPTGEPLPHNEEPRLLKTCMFSSYFTEHMPAIMREVQARYDVDGLFTNGWPPLGGLPVCQCDICRKLASPNSAEYWDQFTERTVELWKLYDGIAKEKKPENLFLANLGAGLRATPNLARLAPVCGWFNCDNQGRGGEPAPIWGAALQGRVATAMMKERTITNVTGAYATGGNTLRWRNTAKSEPEATIWMDQTVASGMTIWYHWVGAQSGLGEDRRWLDIGRRYLAWHARHEAHFVRRRSIANIGVVMGQRTHLFHTPPGEGRMNEFFDGLYSVLLERRCLFDFVHEENLSGENIDRYAVLVLPNIAWLSDAQCAQLREYVGRGGSLVASFETAMFDERGRRRERPGLADLFQIESVGPVAAPNGNGFYARIDQPHEVLRGFANTNWLPGGGHRLPIKAAGAAVLSAVPAYTAYPPELSYDVSGRTDGPAMIVREAGRSRLAYFAGDVERALWRTGDTDLAQLIGNTIAWAARDRRPVAIDGPGLVECFAWETEPGFAVHVLNYTNPQAQRGWLREFFPIGEQRVRMELPAGRQVARVELLRAERDIPFRQSGTAVEFTIPTVVDYEIAALYA